MKWNSLLSESSRCMHQEMDIWKKPQRKQAEKGFSPQLSHSQITFKFRERERISCFSLGNTSMMTLQTIPGVRGRITSNFGCWIQNELFPPSYLRDVPVLFTARMWTVCAFWGIPLPILSLICAKSRGRCSAVWCIWERGNALCPLPKKEVKRGGKTHLPSRCV